MGPRGGQGRSHLRCGNCSLRAARQGAAVQAVQHVLQGLGRNCVQSTQARRAKGQATKGSVARQIPQTDEAGLHRLPQGIVARKGLLQRRFLGLQGVVPFHAVNLLLKLALLPGALALALLLFQLRQLLLVVLLVIGRPLIVQFLLKQVRLIVQPVQGHLLLQAVLLLDGGDLRVPLGLEGF